jgi:hypothetical protein
MTVTTAYQMLAHCSSKTKKVDGCTQSRTGLSLISRAPGPCSRESSAKQKGERGFRGRAFEEDVFATAIYCQAMKIFKDISCAEYITAVMPPAVLQLIG